MISPMDLTGRKILVTGASSGIGKEISILLSQLGASVIMIARNEEKLKEVHKQLEGNQNKYYIYDLKDIAGIEDLINKIVAENGVLNGFVHSAGIGTMRPLQNTTHDFLHDVMLINFYSFVETARIYAKKKNNSGGSIVAISSVSSKVGLKAKTAYSVSKAAVDSSVKTMAAELAAKNIRVNSVLPSFIKTDMYEEYEKITREDVIKKNVLDNQILGLGKPIDVANAVAFLLSDAAKFITGTGMVVDGGYLSVR